MDTARLLVMIGRQVKMRKDLINRALLQKQNHHAKRLILYKYQH